MKTFRILAAACLCLMAAIVALPAHAVTAVTVGSCGTLSLSAGENREVTMTTDGKLCVNATVSATVGGFTPGGTFATLTATGSSASVGLPVGTTVAFQNTGTTTVSCTLGIGSATASASQIQVPASSTVFVTPGSNTFGACIDQTGSASNLVVLAGGSGLGTGFGGGGGSGGGGGAITAAATSYAAGAFSAGVGVDGWDLTQGAKADAAQTDPTVTASLIAYIKGVLTGVGQKADAAWSSGSGSVIAVLKAIAGKLDTIITNTGAAIPAGTAIIGKVGIDQTTPGTTNGVQVNAALPAGTNTIGTVGQLTYPVGATAITASATGTTGATTATLAGAVAKTTYICSLSVRANATANTNVTNTVTGVISGTLSRAMWVPANTAGLGVDEQIYSPCVPASATNTGIAVVSGAPGTGGVVTVNATGYQL